MRGKYITISQALIISCICVSAGAEEMPKFVMSSSMAQSSSILNRMADTPSFVWCGGQNELPCPALTIKTLDIPPRVVVAQHQQAAPTKSRFTIHFRFDRANITRNTARVLNKKIATLLNADAIQIAGYTDSIGKTRYNNRLALKRAQAVKAYFVSHGIQASKITVEAVGRCCYVASNKTADGRRANRRAEVEVTITTASSNNDPFQSLDRRN